MVLGAIVLHAACQMLPVLDRPHPGRVLVEVAQADGQVCVRVGNGTENPVQYGMRENGSARDEWTPGLRLDRSNRAGRWQWLPDNTAFFPKLTFSWEEKELAAAAFFYEILPAPGSFPGPPLPPGRYRVCFRFWQGAQRQEQCTLFSLPP